MWGLSSWWLRWFRYLLVLRAGALILGFIMINDCLVWWLVLFRFGVYVDLVTIDLFGGFIWWFRLLVFWWVLLLLTCEYGADEGWLC